MTLDSGLKIYVSADHFERDEATRVCHGRDGLGIPRFSFVDTCGKTPAQMIALRDRRAPPFFQMNPQERWRKIPKCLLEREFSGRTFHGSPRYYNDGDTRMYNVIHVLVELQVCSVRHILQPFVDSNLCKIQ